MTDKVEAQDKGGFGYPLLGDTVEADEWFAAFAHSRWSEWMKYLFSMCFEYRIEPTLEEPDGELVVVIPKQAFKRWKRQMQTEYKDLPEEEKKSDREEAAKIIQLILSRFA